MALINLLFWGAVTTLCCVLVYATYSLRKRTKYYKKHGIPYLGASLHRTFKFFTGKITLVLLEMDIYAEAAEKNAPFVGVSDVFGSSSLYITDLDMVKNIYVKDFEHFVNRRPVATQQTNLFFKKMLFAMESEQWKGIRSKLSPTFTTGKIRRMFQIFKKSGERMDLYLKAQLKPGQSSLDINFSQIFPKYAMDVIASCAFGIDSQSWDVPLGQSSTFEEMGKRFQFQFSLKMLMKFFLFTFAPKLMDLLGLEAMDYQATSYFADAIKDVMKRRRQTGERREDFLQLMMDAQTGMLKADEETRQVMYGTNEGDEGKEGKGMEEGGSGKVTFDDVDIVANGMLFLLGGFDPTQSVMLFTLYNLALHPEVQKKVFEEVNREKGKNGGELTYEGILEMTYLDLVINETMRLYPPTARTERSCTREYTVPGTDFVIEKGTIVSIPIHPFHHDGKYFPDPEKFIPERFTSDNKQTRHPYAFMPFGHGPRNCIGMRFALVKVKYAIAQLAGSFEFAPCSKTPIPMEFDSSANIKPKGGLWVKMTPRS